MLNVKSLENIAKTKKTMKKIKKENLYLGFVIRIIFWMVLIKIKMIKIKPSKPVSAKTSRKKLWGYFSSNPIFELK